VALPTLNTSEDDFIDFPSIARLFWNGKMVIIATAVVLVVIGGIYAFLIAVPTYKATSVVMLESRESSTAGLDSVIGGLTTVNTSVINTETEVLRSRKLMGKVVESLNLSAYPEFNSSLRDPGMISKLKMWLRGSGTAVSDPEMLRRRQQDGTVSALLNHVEIANVPNSLVFRITASSEDPMMAAQIADQIAEAYINDQLEYRFEATTKTAAWLTTQLATLSTKLEQSEIAVREFQGQTDLINAETLSARERQLKETRNRLVQVSDQIEKTTQRLGKIDSAASPLEQATLTGDDALLQMAHSDLQNRAEQEAFERQLQMVITRQRQELSRLKQQQASLLAASEAISESIKQQSADLITLEQLRRDADSNRLLYEHLQAQLKETTAQLGIQQTDSRVLANATIPFSPAAPRKKLIVAMSGVGGVMLGMLFILLRELGSRTIRNAQELGAITGRNALAQIPQVSSKTRNDALEYLTSNPTSSLAEAIRNLRTSILLSSIDTPPQVILLSSALSNEGKTFLTIALAQNLTAVGRKVLMIEGDLRKREMTAELVGRDTDNVSGLLSVLRGETSLADAIIKTEKQGDALVCEPASVDTVDLFSSERFKNLLAEARKAYDIVLIDSPPVLSVPDARAIAQNSDATILTVRYNYTRREQIREAIQQFNSVNVQVTGFVLNGISRAEMKQYGYESYETVTS
jgi:capsular exopolysaccharide synthesis family protein